MRGWTASGFGQMNGVAGLMGVNSRPGTRILWLLVATIVLLSGASTLLSYRYAEQSNDRVTARSLEQIETTAAAVDAFLDQRIGVLQALATTPVIAQGTPREQDDYFARVDLEAVGFDGGLGLVSLDGRMTAFANAESPQSVLDVSDRSYVESVMASGAPQVGEAVVERPDELLTLPIAVPVRLVDGRMSGVLVGVIRLDGNGASSLFRFLTPDVTVVDGAGHVIVEDGTVAKLRSVRDDPTYREMVTATTGVDRDATDLKGEQHMLVSHAAVETGGWMIVSATPRGEAFGDSRGQLLEELVINGLLSVLALGGAWCATRRLDRAAEAAARSSAVSGAQSRVLERIARRHPLDDIVNAVREEFAALFPTDESHDRLKAVEPTDAEVGERGGSGSHPPAPNVDGPEGEATRAAAHLIEIAVEQERSAGEIVRSERRYRSLVEANSAAVWLYDQGRPHNETSPWWREFTGQAPAEVDDLGWLDAVHPDDRDRTREMWKRVIAAGAAFSDTFRVRSATGEYRELEIRGVPTPTADGRAVEWIGTYVDVTEERRQAEALRISEERLRLAMDAAELGAWDWDLVTGAVSWSPVVERHVGLAPGAFGGTIEAVRAFIHPDDRPHVVERARRALELGEAYSAEFRMIRPDGSTRWTRTSGLVIRDWTGKPLRLLGVDVDITEEKERQRERQLFLASVAHDLKNPIAVLKASAQLLQRRTARGLPLDAEEVKARLAVIDANASRLARRLDDLSDLSQLEAGIPVDLHVGRVDLVDIARSCVDSARRASVAHNLRLETEQESIVGEWDATRIERVLDNLISNAIKYSPDGGEIDVRLWSDTVDAYASVADHGIGVPIPEQTAVFHYQRRGSNVGSIAGSGVGLAGAARLVALAGGELSLVPKDGPGATFVVRLPLRPAGEGHA